MNNISDKIKSSAEKVDIFLSPYIDPPLLPGIKVICTIHDLIFINLIKFKKTNIF